MLGRTVCTTAISLALASASFAAAAADHVFGNAAAITVPASGSGSTEGSPSNPYPSSIEVSGLSGNITHVSVTLSGFSHTWPGDLQVILVAPGGQKIALMKRIGTASPDTGVGCNPDLVAASLTFDASAPSTMQDCSYSSDGGTYLPTIGARVGDPPSPAPTGPYSGDLATLNGSAAAQNGSWSLFISDHAGGDSGSIAGGWSLNITDDAPDTTCASEGYRGTQLTWCKNICENGLSGAVLDTWIHRWIQRYRDLPYCAREVTAPDNPPPNS